MEFAPKEILVATDFSRCAQAAVDYAAAMARSTGARLTLLHVLPVGAHGLAGALPGDEPAVFQFEQALRRHGARSLEHEVERLKATGVEVTGRIGAGRVADEVAAEAQRLGAELIVVGSEGRSGVGHLLLGSVAEGVARRATIPVVIVRTPPGQAP